MIPYGTSFSLSGQGISRVQVKVVDEKDQPLDPGQIGRSLRDPIWSCEVLESADKQKRPFEGLASYGDIDTWMRRLSLSGRSSTRQNHHRGLNVYPEKWRRSYPPSGVAQRLSLASITHSGGGITAAVVTRQGMRLSSEELTEFCKERLAGYKRPKKIYFLEDLPKNLYGRSSVRNLKKGSKSMKFPSAHGCERRSHE